MAAAATTVPPATAWDEATLPPSLLEEAATAAIMIASISVGWAPCFFFLVAITAPAAAAAFVEGTSWPPAARMGAVGVRASLISSPAERTVAPFGPFMRVVFSRYQLAIG